MKKMIFLALTLSAANAHAICPASLNGSWSGSVVKTTNAAFGNAEGGMDQMPPITTNGTFTAIASGGTMTWTYYGESESGGWGGYQETTAAVSYPMTYERATCRGVIDTGERKIYFTVDDSGKEMRGVSNKKENGSFGQLQISSGESAMWNLRRQ